MPPIRDWLRDASSIAVLTGAGISAESGIPTFRGPNGLWRSYRPEDLATPEAFARDPKLVWEWYDWRRSSISQAEPNAAHRALAAFEQRAANLTVITQNVDGLHDRAGSRRVLKVHGDIWTLRCTSCGREHHDPRPSIPDLPPLCTCGELKRPGVVWFRESLPLDVWRNSEQAARDAQVFFVIGTAAVVYPAAGLVALAKSAGAKIVEINVAETPVSNFVDASLRGPAAELLPELLA